MGMLEDLLWAIAGSGGGGGEQGYAPRAPFSGASPEQEEEMRKYFAEQGIGSKFRDISSQVSALKQPDEQALSPNEMAQARFAEEDQAAEVAAKEPPEESPQDMLMRLQKETNQRSLDALTAGLDPNRGTLSQQPDSPELQRRLAERDAWVAQQPMRNLEFAMTPDQVRRQPEYAAHAAGALKGLKEQQAIDRRQSIQELFVQNLAGSGGTIPRDQAAQLQALGVNVPFNAIGSGADEGVAFFDSAIEKAGQFLSNLDQFELASGHPMIKVQQAGAMRAKFYRDLVESGQMNADDAMQRFQRELADMAMQAGVINTQEAASMQQ